MALARLYFLLIILNTGYSSAYLSGITENEEVSPQKTDYVNTQPPDPGLKTKHVNTQPPGPHSLNYLTTTGHISHNKIPDHQYYNTTPGHQHYNTTPGHQHYNTTPGHQHYNTTPGHQHYNTTPGRQHYNTTPGHQHYNTTPGHQHYNTTPGHQHYNTTPGLQHYNTTPGHQHHNTTPGHQHHNTTPGHQHYNTTPGHQHHNTIPGHQNHNTTPGHQHYNTTPGRTTAETLNNSSTPGRLFLSTSVSANNQSGSNASVSEVVENAISDTSPSPIQKGSTTLSYHTVPARITLGPRDQTVCHGSAAMFECQAEGDPLPEMLWFINRVPVLFDRGRFTIKHLASGILLKIFDIDIEHDDRLYVQCMADNGLGPTDVASASVTVLQTDIPEGFPVELEEKIEHKMIQALDTVEMVCGVRGEDPLSVRWYKDMVPLDPRLDKYSAIQDTLLIANTSRMDSGVYTCTAENKYGSVTTNGTTLFVGSPTVITHAPRDHKVLNGSHVIFHCQSEGLPHPKLYWKVQGVRVSRQTLSPYNVQKTNIGSRLLIGRTDYARDHRAHFECVARNDIGTDSATAILEIYRGHEVPGCFPKITSHPKLRAVWLGRPTSLRCSADGSPAPEITWLKDEAWLDVNKPGYAVTVGGALMIAAVQKQDEGTYACMAENSIGTTYSEPAYLYIRDVDSPPAIISTSADPPRIPLGGTANLTCIAIGNPLPYVTWSAGTTRLTDQLNIPVGVATVEISDVTSSVEYACAAYSRLGRVSQAVKVATY